MKQREVIVKGLCVSLYLNGKTKQLIKRRIVSPEWVQLWYLISDGKFDADLWLTLNDGLQDFLSTCVHQTNTHNIEFQKMLARNMKGIYDRLLLIEDSIKMGNISEALVKEYSSIIERLTNTDQMPKMHGSKLIRRLERTLAQQ